MPVNYSLYRSRELVSNTSSTYVDYIRNAAANGFERVYHYNAIPKGVKGIEPHIALCSSAGSEDAPLKLGNDSSSADVASPSPEGPKKTSHSDGALGLPVTIYQGDAKPQSLPSPIAMDHNPRSLPSTSTPQWKAPPSRIPLGRAEDMISWTDDDVDATEYKNMMDYDPNQDENIYDSTAGSDTEATASPPKTGSRVHSGYIQTYINLSDEKTNSSVSEVSATPPSGLLLLFIPGPLNPLPPPPSSSPIPPTTPTKHANFLAHLARYPYLTSHENYIRYTGFVLSSGDADAPDQYLIVQEFSDLYLTRRGRKVGLDWALKRQEAKHWWRKEERGARGVRVGFFELGHVGEVDKISHQ